jgi:hypothetical protein
MVPAAVRVLHPLLDPWMGGMPAPSRQDRKPMAPNSASALPPPIPRAEPVPADAPLRPLPSLRILVVDHDPTLCRHYCEELTRAGHRVDTATNDETGWKVLAAGRRASRPRQLPGIDH